MISRVARNRLFALLSQSIQIILTSLLAFLGMDSHASLVLPLTRDTFLKVLAYPPHHSHFPYSNPLVLYIQFSAENTISKVKHIKNNPLYVSMLSQSHLSPR